MLHYFIRYVQGKVAMYVQKTCEHTDTIKCRYRLMHSNCRYLCITPVITKHQTQKCTRLTGQARNIIYEL